ncbi:RSF1 [Mytilus coruscus]|uniref:RSF1 n=1 Tax=Mytilus coruscus TaxID=42192 RepID=A0A6J8AQH4_MYTCO|nr:RSF1 [Mytilus coruscus]
MIDISENNVRRSSRTRTTRTQSQDSLVKDNKCESKSNLENTEVLLKTDDTIPVNNGDLEKENNKTPSKSKSKVKGKKRPLLFEDNSTEDSPTVEPESKKSKPTKKILTKKSPAKVKSSTEDTDDSDDIPLSQIKGTPKSSGKKTPKATPKKLTPKGKKGKKSEPTPTRKSSRPVKKKKFDSDEEEKESSSKSKKSSASKKSKVKSTGADSDDDDETPLKALQKSESETEEEEEDKGGRRRSSRVKKLMKKSKKKEITPPPSSFEEDEEVEDDDHSDFTVTDSDESDDEFNPAPKGRNARRQAAIQDTQECLVEEIPNDTPCIHCHKTDRPEWLLLCDKCDDGFHTACLRPPLMIIPDGDWFCPPCEHKGLLEKLQISLKDLDIIMKKKDRLIKRKERLAFVGISLDNILKDEHKENVNPDEYEQYSPEEEEYYKPKKNKSFVKRSCRSRNVISYKFDEFDDMINTAIKEDLENPQPYNPGKGRSRGKDMANIYMAEGREYVSEEEGKPSPVGGHKKKKGRRLTNLSDEDDNDDESGDEYKCSDDTSEPPEEVEEDDDDVSDYSLDGEGWCRRGTRRSARRNARSKQYKDFVVDEEDSDYGTRRKSARSTRASTRQRRKHKEVWSDEEEEEEEEETDESIDTEDLCSEDSGPTKKKKNRKEIDKKVFREKEKKKGKHSAKRRRIVDSEEEGSERTEKSEESESKSESDDSSVDIGKIKKAAKRKLSKRRYSESSSESEKSESSEPSRSRRRNIAKRVNYKAIAGSDSEATEVSEDKSGSEKDKRSKKKNIIRDESTDTDDYFDNKSEDAEEGETTEEDEKEPVKPKKQKKDEKEDEEDYETEDETKEESRDEESQSQIVGPDREITKNKDKDGNTNEKGNESFPKDSVNEHETDTEPINSLQGKTDSEPIIESQNRAQISTSSVTVPDSSEQNTPVCQNNIGVIRPSPQYSMGQSFSDGSFTNQSGQKQFQGRSPPYSSPPQQQFISSPPHSSYQAQQPGHMMRQGPPLSQNYPPQMRQVNFPVSTSSQPFTSMSPSQGTISSPPYPTMQERPQYSSQVPQSQGQVFGRSVQGQPMLRGPHPGQQNGGQMQQGIRPEMIGQMRGQLTPQQDAQMIRGPFYPNQQQMMGGRFPNQQQMMMQGQYSSYQSGQMMRAPYPGQPTMMRGSYPNTSQQDNLRGSHSNQEGAVTDQNREEKVGRMKSPPSSQPGLPERPMIPGQQPGFQSAPMIRGLFPGQPHRPMARGPFYGQPESHMMPGQEGHFRPGFPYPAQQRPGLHTNQQGFPHRPLQPGQQILPSQMSGPPVSSPTIGSPPVQETNQQFFPPRQSQARPQMSPSHTPQAIAPVDRAHTKDVHSDQNVKNELDQTSQSISAKDVHKAALPAKEKVESSSVKEIKSPKKKIPEECLETRKNTDTQTSSEKDRKDQVEQAAKHKKENNQPKNIEMNSSESEKHDGQIVTELLSQTDSKILPQNQVTSFSSDIETDKQEVSQEQTTGIESTSGNESSLKVPKSGIEIMPGPQSQQTLHSPPTSQHSRAHPVEETIRGPQPNPAEGSMIRGPQPNPPEGSMIRGPHPNPPEGSMIRGPQPYPPEESIRGPQPNPSEGSMIRGPQPNPPEGSMIRGPHPYQQGMFRGQFNEMMSQMSNQRMQFQQGSVGMPQRPSMQGPPNFVGQVPRNVIPRMRPEHMRPMNPNFQRPMYGPGPMPYQQHPGVPTAFSPRLEMGMRMPQSSGPDETKADSPSKSKMQEGSDSSATSTNEPTKAKKPRKPRQTKKEKMKAQAESKPQSSPGPNVPGQEFHPQQQPQMVPRPHYQMPISRPMHQQQGPYMRPPFDNYGMNGMNQGPPDYNQMNPGMYGPPQMMAGNGGRGFMIDNLLDKHPRVQQLEPIISHEEEDESPVEPDQQTYEGEQSPSNGEKDMDEMSDIGDIVKYVMNH